jgi:hypothetical protein
MKVSAIMPSRAIATSENSLTALTPPRFAPFAIPTLVLALMGCAKEYELFEVRADGVQTAEQKAQYERMDRLLGDRTLSPQQLDNEAVRADPWLPTQ